MEGEYKRKERELDPKKNDKEFDCMKEREYDKTGKKRDLLGLNNKKENSTYAKQSNEEKHTKE